MIAQLTAFALTFPLNCKMLIPSGLAPMLAWGSENVAEASANTRSKSGNIETAIPEVNPESPQTRIFGNAASEIKKFL